MLVYPEARAANPRLPTPLDVIAVALVIDAFFGAVIGSLVWRCMAHVFRPKAGAGAVASAGAAA